MSDSDVETREGEPPGRKVVLHFVRHGEADYDSKDDAEGYLTEKGREQALEAGEKIYQELPDGVVVDFISSSRRRALQTTEAIREKIKELEEAGNKKIIFHDQKREQVLPYERLGMSDGMTAEALLLRRKEKKDEVDYWLEHPGKIPDEIENNFGSFLNHMSSFAHKLGTGPAVHIILTTHHGPSEVSVGKLRNKAAIEPLTNCEEFTITIPTSGRDIEIKYKDLEEKVRLNE